MEALARIGYRAKEDWDKGKAGDKGEEERREKENENVEDESG